MAWRAQAVSTVSRAGWERKVTNHQCKCSNMLTQAGVRNVTFLPMDCPDPVKQKQNKPKQKTKPNQTKTNKTNPKPHIFSCTFQSEKDIYNPVGIRHLIFKCSSKMLLLEVLKMQIVLKFVNFECLHSFWKKFSFTSWDTCLPDRMTVLALGFKLMEQ